MASKNLMVSTHNCLSKFQRLMFSSVAQKNNIVQKPSVKHDGPFSRGNEGSNNNVKYCTVLTMLTTFSLFLYSCKKKFNFEYSLFPTVFAISRNDNSLRSRFNFVADVVEQCENAVVCIESLVSRYLNKFSLMNSYNIIIFVLVIIIKLF